MKINIQTKNIIVTGGYGSGKTSYLNFLGNRYAFDYERIKMTYRWLYEFDEKHGITGRELPPHFVYSADKMKFQKEGNDILESHDFDPSRFGLQKYAPKGVRVQWFPFGSVLIADEAYRWFPSGNDADLVPKFTREGIKIERHRGLDIILAAPRVMDINNSIRDCCENRHIVKREVLTRKNKCKITWHIDSVSMGNIEAYLHAKATDKHLYSTSIVETCDFNVFDLYNPYSHCDDWDEGLTVEDFVI